ncbi:TATA-binding protein-associated factor 2N like [Actinidia chinensis var. chinensis]|uniref:TATA-binding protein-associated factor 2N like n=1 Tax=Actinidia chinensis var. chinensis TaxID=1590841 RepID=A0A2R6R4D7_ACTCC|nr:TATA-binding protein-associated factor 2N like [Actinidia chinensis var. chinensis]
MGTRERDQTTTHQPLLSSLVVRPTDSGGGAGGGGSDYEPGEVRVSDRFSDKPGYRIRAGSGSPVRRRNAERRYSPDFDTLSGIPRGRGYGSGRSPGRYRHYSPPYGRGRGGGGRFMDRGFDGPGFGPGPFKGEGLPRNNANVRPREGDWICPDPSCKNLNFARRDHCNNCNRFRYAPGGSPPRRGYLGPPPPHALPRRFPGPPMDRSPVRMMNGGYRSPPPRGRARDGPREFGAGGPPHARYEGRFPDHHLRRDRPDYPAEDFRDRSKFDRPMPQDLGNRDRGRDSFFNERKGYERRPPSPPLPPPMPPPRGRWPHDSRERSRSPIRGGPPLPPKDYRRDMYMERGRDERRGMGRDRIGDMY